MYINKLKYDVYIIGQLVEFYTGYISELPKKLTLNKLALIGEAEKSP